MNSHSQGERLAKSFLMFLTGLALASCIVATGTAPDGSKYAMGSVGTDAETLDVLSSGFHAKGFNQSRGLKIVATAVERMWKAYLMEQGLEFLAGQYYSLQGAKVASAKAIEIEKLHNAASAAEAQAQLDNLHVLYPNGIVQ